MHLGHRHLIDGMAREAHAAGLPAVVITFFPHPAAVLRGLSGPLYLTPVEERAGLLGEAGADQVATLRFDRDLAALPAEAFMRLVSAATGLRRL